MLPTLVSLKSAIAPLSLEECLLEMARYGNPSMIHSQWMNESYWKVFIKMHVNAANVKFEVEGKGATPTEAAHACFDNMVKAIADVNQLG